MKFKNTSIARNSMIKDPLSQRIFAVFNYVLLVFIIIVTLYPFWHALMVSISRPSLHMVHRGLLFKPLGLDTASYAAVFRNPNLGYGFYNSFVNLAIGVSLAALLTFFAAYALNQKKFYFRKPVMILIVLTMFVSGGLIPLYLTVSNLGLMNSRWSIILPPLISTYNIVVTRVYFSSIPDSLEESASLDGANDLRILFNIILPVSKPIIAVILLFYTVEKWNAWFLASIFLNTRRLFPISLILREILISNDTSSLVSDIDVTDKEPIAETIKYATMVITVMPIVVIYPFLQKYFIKGVMLGSIKE